MLPDPAAVLGTGRQRGGYLRSQTLKPTALPAGDADDHWWIPPDSRSSPPTHVDAAATNSQQARQHFFLPRRYRDPFGQDAFVDFDANDLLMVETRDALGNRVTVDANDYRVLQPRLVSDPNRNQTEVAFDTLGMVVGTAVMGKPLPAAVEGDSLAGFVADLDASAARRLLRRGRPARACARRCCKTPPRASSTTSTASAARGRPTRTTRRSGNRPARPRSPAKPTSARRCRRRA